MRRWSRLQSDIAACDACPRLRRHCQHIAETKRKAFRDWEYWGRPVPNFGEAPAPILIVGLAPAAHGANRTGRMFTGDRSGDWLYRAMHRSGLANQPTAVSRDDGLNLQKCVITAVCHCAPPDNKPTSEEVRNCRPWLDATLDAVSPKVFLALGQLAWRAVLQVAAEREWYEGRRPKFGHGNEVEFADTRWLIGSYHPSQQNTFTGRLTEQMLDDVFRQVVSRAALV